MLKWMVLFCLLPSVALAQEKTPDAADYYKGVIANCTAESASLYEQANKFAKQVQVMQKELDDLKRRFQQEDKK